MARIHTINCRDLRCPRLKKKNSIKKEECIHKLMLYIFIYFSTKIIFIFLGIYIIYLKYVKCTSK